MPHKAFKGSALMIAGLTLLMLTVLGLSLSGLNLTGGSRLIADKTQNQLIYLANSGVQEAIARRFYPRSNYEAFLGSSTTPDPKTASRSGADFYVSGQVFSDVAGAAQVVGVYRYFILGGDPAQSRLTGNYQLADKNFNLIEAVLNSTTPESLNNQPFLVVSEAAVCESSPQTIAPGGIGWNNDGSPLTCPTGQTIRRVTAVATVNTYITPNRITDTQYFYDADTVQLPFFTTLPDDTQTNEINFEVFWTEQLRDGNALLMPLAVIFHPPVTGFAAVAPADIKVENITGTTTNRSNATADRIARNALIRILFRGAFNPLEITPNVTFAAFPPSGGSCDVLDTSTSIIPVLPYGNQIMILPASANFAGMGSDCRYEITINQNLPDGFTRKVLGPTDYKIRFYTKP